jgi:hypothetical protein
LEYRPLAALDFGNLCRLSGLHGRLKPLLPTGNSDNRKPLGESRFVTNQRPTGMNPVLTFSV